MLFFFFYFDASDFHQYPGRWRNFEKSVLSVKFLVGYLGPGEEYLLNISASKKVCGSVRIANAVIDILRDLVFQRKNR